MNRLAFLKSFAALALAPFAVMGAACWGKPKTNATVEDLRRFAKARMDANFMPDPSLMPGETFADPVTGRRQRVVVNYAHNEGYTEFFAHGEAKTPYGLAVRLDTLAPMKDRFIFAEPGKRGAIRMSRRTGIVIGGVPGALDAVVCWREDLARVESIDAGTPVYVFREWKTT